MNDEDLNNDNDSLKDFEDNSQNIAKHNKRNIYNESQIDKDIYENINTGNEYIKNAEKGVKRKKKGAKTTSNEIATSKKSMNKEKSKTEKAVKKPRKRRPCPEYKKIPSK